MIATIVKERLESALHHVGEPDLVRDHLLRVQLACVR